ncbi:phosphodiester glycosidase family protein [Histidinibacterium aquaticum]|uniref:Phosphodiester glycosidase domain-containing protein n=1 Tax=Histidinibacterium aquaticum TaxID=2613962 RepID=A0A5J5GDJ3_9RHOB|nr:phosphodiester glycosidase family protein [Histidinibacterium aquaticum]KAA9006030.1 hypothetical protein F3S47_15875 [Histidinibacterium aquaticum]
MIWLALAFSMMAAPAAAVECGPKEWRGTDFTICEVDPAREQIRLFLNDDEGRAYGSFREVEEVNGPLAFAMNGGMYHEDLSPVGHYVEDGEEIMRVIPNAGPGNFGMLPNGVFCVEEERARVIETGAYESDMPDCRFASQSGPMLVIDGALHPRFIKGSDSRHIRNGVGASAEGDRVVFAISEEVVNFHDFATLFRDGLGLSDALYFDGKVSRLHAPEIGRSDAGWAMGPIVGVLDDEGAGS